MKVICIDDDKMILKYLENFFNKLSGPEDTFYYYSSSVQGLEELKKIKPNLVVLDLMMPEMTGLEILKEIKDLNQEFGTYNVIGEHKIEVVVLTAEKDIKTAVEAMKLGASDYLQKPLNKTILETKFIHMKTKIKSLNYIEEELFTKVITEDRIAREISSLEIEWYNYKECITKIEDIIKKKINSDKKIDLIEKIITEFFSAVE